MANLQSALEHLATQLNGTGEAHGSFGILAYHDEVAERASIVVRVMRPADNDAKVTSLQAVEAQLRVSENQEQDTSVFENAVSQLKLALKSNNNRVAAGGLSCSQALFAALTAQAASSGTQNITGTLEHAVVALVPAPGILAYGGDSKEATRELAGQALLQAGRAVAGLDAFHASHTSADAVQANLDKLVKEQGFASKNARTREQILHYITVMRSEFPNLPLRPWVSSLVATLEDPDSTVRDTARASVISIFTLPSVGNAARADLKKEMLKKGVRKGTSDAVLKGVLGGAASNSASNGTRSAGSSVAGDIGTTSSNSAIQDNGMSENGLASNTATPAPASKAERPLKQQQSKDMSHDAVLAKLEAVAAAAPAPPEDPNAGVVHIVYIASARDLEQEFQTMLPHFTGKENEHNWGERERAVFRIRGMLKGDVHNQFRDRFVQDLKAMQDGIMKATASLRTTLAAAACHLVIGLAEGLQHGLDPLYDTWTTALLKLASLTKKTIAQLSQDALGAIIRHCSYHGKILPLLSGNLEQQKNVQARAYTAGHFKLFLDTQAATHKHAIEVSGGLEILQVAIKHSLADANAAVRDHARASYWRFNEIWPTIASTLFDSLDASARKQLEKADPKKASIRPPVGMRGASTSSQASTSGRPSVRALISSRRAAAASSTSEDPTNGESTAPAPIPTPRQQSDNTSSTSAHARPATSPSSTPRSRPSSFYGKSPTPTTPSPKVSPAHTQPRQGVHERLLSGTSTGRQASPARSSPLGPSTSTTVRPHDNLYSSSHMQSEGSLPTSSHMASKATVQPQPPSPSLLAMAEGNGHAALESPPLDVAASVPLPKDTPLGDETLDFMRYKSPHKNGQVSGKRASSSSEESRDLDRTMDVSFTSQDGLEVDEAVQGRAEQAQETAHRFLELTEQDDNEVSALPSSAPAKNTASDIAASRGGQAQASHGAAASSSQASLLTPLVQRMQAVHLRDSPAVDMQNRMLQSAKQGTTNDSWWLMKSSIEVSKAKPFSELPDEVLDVVISLENDRARPEDLVRLAAFSAGQDATAAIWQQPRLFSRFLNATCVLLARDTEDDLSEPALILLKNLVNFQYDLLGGREIEIFGLLLDLRRRHNKGIAAAAQVVAQQLSLERMEPLYALSSLRTSLQEHLKKHTRPNGAFDGETATSYGMTLRLFGSLFSQLPSEVLEEELVRVTGLIRTALNNPSYTHLRQACVSALAKAHVVLQDDDRLFAILGGLTQPQINLCTYFFARESSK